MPQYISPPPQNPLSKIITAIVAVLALAASFVVGFAALLVIAGVSLIVGIGIWLRVAWIKRRMRQNGVEPRSHVDMSGQSGRVIDAEYTVVSDSEDDQTN